MKYADFFFFWLKNSGVSSLKQMEVGDRSIVHHSLKKNNMKEGFSLAVPVSQGIADWWRQRNTLLAFKRQWEKMPENSISKIHNYF